MARTPHLPIAPVVPALLIAVVALVGASAQAPPPAQQTQAAQQATPAAARTVTPEQQAYNNAMALTDPAKKLEALRKWLADYPNHAVAGSAESAILGVLLTSFKDHEAEIAETLESQLKRIPANTPPDARIGRLVPIVTRLVDANLMMDRAEVLLNEALGKLDREGYIKTRRESAERARKSAEERRRNPLSPPTTPPAPLPPLPIVPSDETLGQQFDRTQSGAVELIGRIRLAAGDMAGAEAAFRKAFDSNSLLLRAPIELSKIALARGDNRAALDYQIPLALSGRMKRSEEADFEALYRKVHGDGVNVDAAIDHLYRERFPNPVTHPEKFNGPRSGRVALLEMFTGSGCLPCVSADLALDAVLDRYPADSIAVLAYHAHIPLPDPMTVPGGDARKTLYAVPGVPTFNVDGTRARLGGGSRENTGMTYGAYVPVIDKALGTPAEADLTLTASASGSRIAVKATISNVKGNSTNLRVHFVLAERHLTFPGENGIRFHPFVVRDVAGDKSDGYPLGDVKGSTTVEHVFDVGAIPNAVSKSLTDELAKRRKTENSGSQSREFRAEDRPMIAIDPGQLVVVAFVQDATNTAAAAPPAAASAVTSGTVGAADATTSATSAPAPAQAGAPARPAAAPVPIYRVLQAAWVVVR